MPRLDLGGTRTVLCVVLATLVATVGVASAQTLAPIAPPSLSPAITEIEADWKRKGRIKLIAEAVPRGAKVVKVTFRYRKKTFKAKKGRGPWTYVRTVKARGGDGRGDAIRFKVKACTATRCATRTGTDEAGG